MSDFVSGAMLNITTIAFWNIASFFKVNRVKLNRDARMHPHDGYDTESETDNEDEDEDEEYESCHEETKEEPRLMLRPAERHTFVRDAGANELVDP